MKLMRIDLHFTHKSTVRVVMPEIVIKNQVALEGEAIVMLNKSRFKKIASQIKMKKRNKFSQKIMNLPHSTEVEDRVR